MERISAFPDGGLGSIPVWGTKILQAVKHSKKKKKKGIRPKFMIKRKLTMTIKSDQIFNLNFERLYGHLKEIGILV